MKSKTTPPKFFLRFFRWYCHPKLLRYIEGDLVELYQERVSQIGRARANWRFILDVILLFRPGIIKPAEGYRRLNHYGMYKSYLKIGWRNLLRNQGYSFINIGGLALGLTVTILIGLWLHDELTYNRYFKNADRIAQVMQNQTFDGKVETWKGQAWLLGPALRENYGASFDFVVMSTGIGSSKLTFNDITINKSGSFMEPGVSEMLSLKILCGTSLSATDMNSVLISSSTATALFGDDDPINKVIGLDDSYELKVVGVYEDIPANTHFARLHVIAPWQLFINTARIEHRAGWGNSWFWCYAQIASTTTIAAVSEKIKDVKARGLRAAGEDDRFKAEIFLFPMERWKLFDEFENGISVGGDIQYVWMFGTVGVFVLLLACINFMNLATARSEGRVKEVGVRKTVGSVRSQLIRQFLTESTLVVVLACLLALAVTWSCLPLFNEMSRKAIAFPWAEPLFWLSIVSFTLLTGLMAGSYPALFLSSFKPIKALKGHAIDHRSGVSLRKTLVVVQFSVSVTLIIATLAVFRQIQHARNRPLGYTLQGLVSAPLRGAEMRGHFNAIRNELLQTGVVEEVASTDGKVTSTYTTNSGFDWPGKDPSMAEEFVTLRVSHEFGQTVGWEIIEGRDFSRDISSDSNAFIINQAAAQYMGLENPVGETLTWGDNGQFRIVGVVKDLVSQNPYQPVKQMLYILNYNRANSVSMRLNPHVSVLEGVEKIEPVFNKYDPNHPFEIEFADQEFAKKFEDEQRVGNLVLIFSCLAIFISCIGLMGLASFVSERRTKEIGIRKVLGATRLQVWKLLSQEFLVLVVISCGIAIPVSYYFLNSWLSQYPYRTGLPWQLFGIASFGACILALATISFHAIRASLLNPVKSLKAE